MRSISILLMALCVPAAAAPMGSMRIVDAVYGNIATRQLCDATEVIGAICDGKDLCAFPASNALCGDPSPLVPKRLFLAFKCGFLPVQTLIAPETAGVRLSCPKGLLPGKPT